MTVTSSYEYDGQLTQTYYFYIKIIILEYSYEYESLYVTNTQIQTQNRRRLCICMRKNKHKYLNEYFDILRNERRRISIRIMTELEEVSISELSEGVASVEYGKEPRKLSSDERKRVYTSMSQVHIPKLKECGVVRYDGRKIEPTKKNDELARYLHELEREQKPALQWMFLFAMSSVALASVASTLFFWEGVKRSGDVSLAAVLFTTVTAIIFFYMAYTHLLKGGESVTVVDFLGEKE